MDSCRNCHIHSEAYGVLKPPEMEQFEKGCTQVHFEKRDKVTTEGVPTSHVLYLKKGLLKFCLKGSGGKDLILQIMSPGSFVGLHDVFAGKVRYCSAIALTNATVCFISHDVFTMLIRNNGDFALEILKYISLEEIKYFVRFLNMQEKQVNGRVAEMIVYLADEIFHTNRFTIALTQSEMGTMIGTTRESVSRVIKEFRDDGILSWHHQTIEILNKDLLVKISKAG
ncbi:MAG: Crp/Fnr family transcriptional regulator [Chlorobi bacterium]|nr:Crp/Fnr family transcriptional regulator [Chlorobiota bacterium]